MKRYFKAAEEAAQEVIREQMLARNGVEEGHATDETTDSNMASLVNISENDLNSPSRMIALQLANNNPSFR